MNRAVESPAVRCEARRVRAVTVGSVWIAFLLGLAAGLLSPSLAIGVVAVALLPVAQWRWPSTGPIALLAGALLIEQFPLPRSDLTDHIPLFRSLQSFGVSGVVVSSLEILLVMVLMVWLLRRAQDRSPRPPRSPLTLSMVIFLVLVFFGLAVGLSHGGDLRSALWEMRPWIYLAVVYALASSVLATRRSIKAVMWTVVICTGIKGIQGALLFTEVYHLKHRPQALLAHEEAFFYGLFVALTLGLWIFGVRGRLRTTATVLLPIVLLADMVNSRRTAFAILGADLLLILVLAYVRLPERRKVVRRVAVVSVVGAAIYLPAYWNDVGGTAGQPARAIRTIVAPTQRDRLSDQYRKTENFNLVLNVRDSGPLGKGWGLPIVNGAPIVDLTNIDSFIAFVPHNGVLYIWMRLGILGELAFWSVIAAGTLMACRCLRSGDQDTALLGMLVICALVGYLIMGYYDMGFFWFRIAVAMGCLLGAVDARARLAEGGQSELRSAPLVSSRAIPPASREAQRVPATVGELAWPLR